MALYDRYCEVLPLLRRMKTEPFCANFSTECCVNVAHRKVNGGSMTFAADNNHVIKFANEAGPARSRGRGSWHRFEVVCRG